MRIRRQGFTVVELLVVIVILATLAAISVPIGRSMVGRAKEAACLSQLRSLGVGLQSYLAENGNIMPTLNPARRYKGQDVPVLETVLLPYVGSEEGFHCPADAKDFKKSGCSYFWNSTQNGLHASKLSFFGIKDNPAKTPLITDKESYHPHGTNFLYADLSSSRDTRFQVETATP
jgi:prepilin-type N-terminal cleavage/methylation domain-containing protein